MESDSLSYQAEYVTRSRIKRHGLNIKELLLPYIRYSVASATKIVWSFGQWIFILIKERMEFDSFSYQAGYVTKGK